MAQIFNQREGISSHLGTIWGAWSFPRVALLILIFYRLETRVSGNLCQFLKEDKAIVLHAVEHGIAMEQIRGKSASSCVDFGYTDLFCIPELTSEFISSCDSVLGDSLVFYQENRGYLRV